MSRISNQYYCECCGEAESNSGCVRGPRCGCFSQTKCYACEHCIDHHHRNCDDAFRDEYSRIWAENLLRITDLRKKYKVDIFEIGVNKELDMLNNLRRRLFDN